ncbi:MAG TPA: YybS family protein, partial [Clostridia bacterium]|nr:YybS family protein [Clostridia bacterium]
IWLVMKYGLKTSILSLLGAFLLMVVSGGSVPSVFLILLQYGLLGVVIGLLFKNHLSGRNVIIATLSTASVFALIVLVVTLLAAGGGGWLIDSDIQGALEQVMAFYKEAGLIQDTNSAQAEAVLEDMVRVSKLLFPSSIVLMSMGWALLTLIVARVILRRFKFDVPALPPFRDWSLSWVSIWGLIVGLGFSLLGDEMSWAFVSMVGKNLLLVFVVIYLLLGISFATFLFKKYNISKFLKIIIVVIAVFYWPVALILFFTFGVLDTLLNLRDRIRKKEAQN